MDFRGRTRYIIADPALTDFVTEFYQFYELENEFLNIKWQYSGGPTFNEVQSRRVLYSDETKSEKFFNVRELQSALKYALVQTAGDVLTPDALPEMIQKVPARTSPPVAEQAAFDVGQLVSRLLRDGEPDIYRKVCLAVDRAVMEAVLRYAKGNQVQASELLGISRTTLRAKLRILGMAIEKQLLPQTV